MAEQYSTIWIVHILFIHSSADGHSGCFHFLAIIKNAAMNICIQIYVLKFDILGYMS